MGIERIFAKKNQHQMLQGKKIAKKLGLGIGDW
jgi:ABC-type lipoprotein release transport system permease subunit